MKDELNTHINEYRKHLNLLNTSDRTVKEYVRLLGKFVDFLNREGVDTIEGITVRRIMDFQRNLYYYKKANGDVLNPCTQNNYLKVIKSFCKYLHKEGYLLIDPAKEIAYAREPQQLPKDILTKSEIEQILTAVDIQTSLGYRDRTILEVFYSSGIRRMELINLQLGDVETREGYIRIVSGKGDNDRIVPLGRIACKYVENYIRWVRSEFVMNQNINNLFLSKRGNAMSENAVKGMVIKYAKLAKINKRVYPHLFRHTCATHLVQNQANIRSVQEILGHKSLETTQMYVRLTIRDLKDVHKRCHPRENSDI
jgi:integrase/recombinase XerD